VNVATPDSIECVPVGFDDVVAAYNGLDQTLYQWLVTR